MVEEIVWLMSPPTSGIGTQKKARLSKLKEEITRFVFANPGCSAQTIVAHLTHDKKLKNHGLTPRKVGFFIPRHLNSQLVWWQDAEFTVQKTVNRRQCEGQPSLP